jgi:hypothetical protein
MKINKVYCFFEQSGTFKNAFKRAGIDAADYDIQNMFGETDVVIDLFDEIDRAYMGQELSIMLGDKITSIFDEITPDDLIFAFFPCIYFSQFNQFEFRGESLRFAKMTETEKLKCIITRSNQRQNYYEKLLRLCYICVDRGLRLIVENPYSPNHYLYNNFPYRPAIIDYNRHQRGDYFVKPTQYYCINFEPSKQKSVECAHDLKRIKSTGGHHASGGLCDVERSMISPEYATNFINDYILGIRTEKTERTLFDNL